MNKDTFGDHLKREREMRGVTLDEISAATRIATRFLKAIENEQWDQLPGGVFNRGFVRAVAHYLGLDEENIVAEYALAVGDRPSVPVWTGSPPAVAPQQPWLAWILAAAIAIAVIAGSWFGVRRIVAWRAARRAAHGTAAGASSVASPETQPNIASAAPGDNSSPSSLSSTPTSPTGTSNSSGSAAATPPSASPDASASTAELQLKVETGRKTRVRVETDAHRAFDGNIEPGQAHTFTAQDRFQVSAKDAGALLLELNGKMLDPIGPPGHAGKVTLTREALKSASGGGN
jgi:cytoskeleton protein RodZ